MFLDAKCFSTSVHSAVEENDQNGANYSDVAFLRLAISTVCYQLTANFKLRPSHETAQ